MTKTSFTTMTILSVSMLFSTGCFTRTVYVQSDPNPVQMNQNQVASEYDVFNDDVEPQNVSNVSVFYNTLSPYGQWVSHPTYGQVFLPSGVAAGWQPYTNGQWAYTNFGWTWRSRSNFGWATSHYGRWGHSASLGWYWVPGTTWGPAWVSWRTGTYMGWAPLGPTGVTVTVGGNGWVFAATNDFYQGRRNRYIRSSNRAYRNCVARTNIYRTRRHTVRGRTYIHGPDRRHARLERIQTRRIARTQDRYARQHPRRNEIADRRYDRRERAERSSQFRRERERLNERRERLDTRRERHIERREGSRQNQQMDQRERRSNRNERVDQRRRSHQNTQTNRNQRSSQDDLIIGKRAPLKVEARSSSSGQRMTSKTKRSRNQSFRQSDTRRHIMSSTKNQRRMRAVSAKRPNIKKYRPSKSRSRKATRTSRSRRSRR